MNRVTHLVDRSRHDWVVRFNVSSVPILFAVRGANASLLRSFPATTGWRPPEMATPGIFRSATTHQTHSCTCTLLRNGYASRVNKSPSNEARSTHTWTYTVYYSNAWTLLFLSRASVFPLLIRHWKSNERVAINLVTIMNRRRRENRGPGF
jgi:hypothetical protein